MTKRRLLSAILVFMMLASVNAFALSTNDNQEKAINETILQQALVIDQDTTLLNKDFDIVSLCDASNTAKALRTFEQEGDTRKVITVIPYKIMEDGSAVNSFSYLSSEDCHPTQTRDTYPYTATFVDLSVTITTYYNANQNTYNTLWFYRHVGITAYWSSSDSSVTVTNFVVMYNSKGDLYSYTGCLGSNYSSYFLQSDYQAISVINVTSPTKGQVYNDMLNAMPTDRRLLLTDYFDHGGLVSLFVTYNKTGVTGAQVQDSYYVYQK